MPVDLDDAPSITPLIHIAALPPAVTPPSPWSASQPLHGRVFPPHGRGPHDLEPLVCSLCASLNEALAKLRITQIDPVRLAVWRVSPCAALALSVAARRAKFPLIWLNDRWSADEAKRALHISNSLVLITGTTSAPPFTPPHIPVLGLLPLPSTAVTPLRASNRRERAGGTGGPNSPTRALPHDESVFFTSGTGGLARGARLAHSAMDVQAAEKVSRLPFARGGAYLHLAPHFHVAGASSALAALHAGCDHVFPPCERGIVSRAGEILDLVQAHRVAMLVAVPTVLRALVDTAAARAVVCPSVRCVLYGGARLGAPLQSALARLCPRARLVGTYGMTEAASSLAFAEHVRAAHDDARDDAGGQPPPHVQLAVRAPAPGVKGPVLTRGPHLMRGYCGEAGRDARDWFETGDLGVVDAASRTLTIVGRMRDVIRTGGESVFAGEVEEALETHPGVRESAVVGVPHRLLGEAVAAAVVVKADDGLPARGLLQWCRERLSAYKVPKWIFQVDGLPTNALGKVVKPRLKLELERRLSVERVRTAVRAKL